MVVLPIMYTAHKSHTIFSSGNIPYGVFDIIFAEIKKT